jgi:DNA-binding winged helix-turn-helix (wHTH) protein/tetratricopeptide (TPR) repeat protein
MSTGPILRFGPFELDRQNQELFRNSERLSVPPKIFAILEYFALNAGRLVTRQELLDAVWGPISVGDAVVRGYIRDIRSMLRDDATHPRFIETVPRRGFRFLPKVTAETTFRSNPKDHPVEFAPPPGLFGRKQALLDLHRCLEITLGGKRQAVLIAGEAGIGKSALLNAFLDQVRAIDSILVACGQCVEQFGTREAYLPVFDALGALCRGARANSASAVLNRYAPSWLVQMPGLLPNDQLQNLQIRVQGTTQTRMLGEFCEAMEALSVSQPIVLGLEDLQWSDPSTVDMLSAFARRSETARLMLIGTYRPADVVLSGHPLRIVAHDLQVHGCCVQILPENLNLTGVSDYLAHRFAHHRFPRTMVETIYRTSGGNPLFVTAMVDDLVNDGAIVKRPGAWRLRDYFEQQNSWKSPSLRQLIDAQLSRLPEPEQRVLEAAAAVGNEFGAETVASVLEIDPVEVEERCEALVRRGQVLRRSAKKSERRPRDHSRYEFVHDLYRAGAFDRSSQARRSRWYRRIAQRIVTDWGDRADEVATELAYYFESADMPLESARYCAIAGEKAIRRFADAEALGQFRRGIEILKAIPASSERDSIELRLQVGLAFPLINSQGYTTEEAVEVVRRASELNEKLGDGPQSFAALRGLYLILTGKSDYKAALELCDQMDRVAQRDPDPYPMAEAIRLRGVGAFFLGRLVESREALNRSLLASRAAEGSPKVSAVIDDLRVTSASILALAQWMLGYPEQAVKSAQYALDRAMNLGAPFSTAIAHCFRAMLQRFLRDTVATIEEAESAIAICDKFGFPIWRAQAALERGWARTMQDGRLAGIQEIRSALAAAPLALGGSMAKLAEACLRVGKTQEGLRAVDEAMKFVREHEEGAWEPELHRLKGELLLQRAERRSRARDTDFEQAKACFSNALRRARENEAKSLELRAAMSLHKIWSRQGKRAEARRIVAEVYDRFSEGFDTPDLRDARGLLDRSPGA